MNFPALDYSSQSISFVFRLRGKLILNFTWLLIVLDHYFVPICIHLTTLMFYAVYMSTHTNL